MKIPGVLIDVHHLHNHGIDVQFQKQSFNSEKKIL